MGDDAAGGIAGAGLGQFSAHGFIAMQGRDDGIVGLSHQGMQVDLVLEHHQGDQIALIQKVS